MSERTHPAKCPNPLKGTRCEVCGGSFVCLEFWRKKRTYIERVKARKEFRKESRR